MKCNIYDKEYVIKRVNEILSIKYLKKFRNNEIYTAINQLEMEELKILLLPSYTEAQEKIIIYIIKHIKEIMLENRKNKKELNKSLLLRTNYRDKGIIFTSKVDNINDVVEKNKHLLYNDLELGSDLEYLNNFLDQKDQSISDLSKEYFFSSQNENNNINSSVMWKAIQYSDFDNNTKIVANYLFSGNEIDVDEAALMFKREKSEIINIRQECIKNYKEYVKNPSSYEYKNVDNK